MNIQNKNLKIYSAIWNALNQTELTRLEKESIQWPQAIEQQFVQKYFTDSSQYRWINLSSITREDQEFIENSGLSLEYLKLNQASKSNMTRDSLENRERNSLDSTQNLDLVAPWRGTAAWRTDFQQSLVEQQCICAVCPSTGKLLTSNVSFPFGSRDKMEMCAYRFIGEEVFYLITGGPWFEKHCLYFPKRDLAIRLHDLHVYLKPDTGSLNTFKAYCVSRWNKVSQYISDSHHKKVALFLGFIPNIGHYFWNELSGIQKISEHDKLSDVDKYVITESEFFGKIDEIFPEIDPGKVERIPLEGAMDKVLDQNYFALRAGHMVIQENLVHRVYQTSLKKCSSDFLDTMKQAKKCFPLIWVTIRLGSRTWISQVDGIANIIISLSQKFPDLGIVINGFICPATGLVNTQHEVIIQKENKVANQIKSRLPDTIKIYDLIGCIMHENVVCSSIVDLYLSPWGSTLVTVAGIANKPGVIYGNQQVLQLPFLERCWWLVGRERKGNVPIFISKDKIVDVNTNNRNSLKILYNYECDWLSVYKNVIQLIISLKEEKQKHMDRTIVLQTSIDQKHANVYLEIGVNKGANFLKIRAKTKVAVDPMFRIADGYQSDTVNQFYEETSDEFFETQSDWLSQHGIDVVLIDGLHTYEQSLKDVLNCLQYLNEGGVIVMHDCNPQSKASAHPVLSEASQIEGWSGAWHGDVWKTIVYLRSQHPDLNVFTLDCDWGLGILSKGTPEEMLDYSDEDIASLTYEDLDKNRSKFLNLKHPSYFNYFLAEQSLSPKKSKNDLQKYFENNQGRLIHKWMHYFEIYDRHLSRFKNQEVYILEIGVSQGGSLQMWKNYFGEKAVIYGVDVNQRCKQFEEDQIKIFIGDQANRNFLRSLKDKCPRIDILIDDGGHLMAQQINTFEELFPHLSEDGVYICEDLHTSYWAGFGGGYRNPNNFIEYSKNLIDQLNAWHSRDSESFKVSNFTRSTHSMHYYDSVLVIEKRIIDQPTHRKTGKPSF